MRIAKTVSETTTDYVLDLAATAPVVISDTDAVYLCGLDILAEQLAGADRYYYVHDGLGSVRQVLDSTGQIETKYAYDPFGVPLAGDGVPNPWQFTSEAWDAEVELLYLRARYYQPETGRFVTKDPWPGDLWRPGTLNPYVYVGNNPVNLTDASGLNGEEPLDFLLWDPPPVVTWIRDEMVQNAQSDVLRSISDLNRRSKSLRGHPAGRMKQAALLNFGWMVRQGGPWDPKPYIADKIPYYNYHRIAGHFYYYDVWGNIMFGYLGIAAGFSESELLEGAGLEQIGSDTWYAIYYRDPCRLPRPRQGWSRALRLWTWDHPEDRVTARIGMRLWSLYQTGVQTYHIIQAVVEAGDRQEISRHKLPVFIYDPRYRKSYQHEPWYKELEEEYWRGFRSYF